MAARTHEEAAAFIIQRCGGDLKKAAWWADAHRAENFALNPVASAYWHEVEKIIHSKQEDENATI